MPSRVAALWLLVFTVLLSKRQLTTASAYWQYQRTLLQEGTAPQQDSSWGYSQSNESEQDFAPGLLASSIAAVPRAVTTVCSVGTNTTATCDSTCQVCQRTGRRCTCCKPGYIPNRVNPWVCTSCPIGSIAPVAGSSSCRPCTDGRSTKTRAGIKCDYCRPGTEFARERRLSPNGSARNVPVCRNCTAGFISSGGLQNTRPKCTACPAGTTTVGNSRTRCAACLPGYGGAKCDKCPEGFYSLGGPTSRRPTCKPCPSDGSGPRDQCGVTPPSPGVSPQPSPVLPSPSPSPPPAEGIRADISVNTTGLPCREQVAVALADAVKAAILARTAPAKQRFVTVDRGTCSNNGRKLLAVAATYDLTASTSAAGDVDALRSAVTQSTLVVSLNAAVKQLGVTVETAGVSLDGGDPIVVQPPSPQPSPQPSPRPPSPQPPVVEPPLPEPPRPQPPVQMTTCEAANYTCTAGRLIGTNAVAVGRVNDAACCTSCASFNCEGYSRRVPSILAAGNELSFEICCDACSKVTDCGKVGKVSPLPLLSQRQETRQLCCNLPPVVAPTVSLALPATGCSAEDVAALTASFRGKLTEGMIQEKASKITVESECIQANRRRSLLSSRTLMSNHEFTVRFIVKIAEDITDPTEVTAATKVLIEAVGLGDSESLPANATIQDLAAVLETITTAVAASGGGSVVEQLVQTIQSAIQEAAVTIEVVATTDSISTTVAQVARCQGLPRTTQVNWPAACANTPSGTECVGVCSTEGQVTAVCSINGTWERTSGECAVRQQTVVSLSCNATAPSATITSAVWPNCTGLRECNGACSGDTFEDPVPSSICDSTTGSWTTPVGRCSPIRCPIVPNAPVSAGKWPPLCPSNSIGAACTGLCNGAPAGVPLVLPRAECTRNPGVRKASWTITSPGNCVDTYPDQATCTDTDGPNSLNTPVFRCGTGLRLRQNAASIDIAGLTEARARTQCCQLFYAADATCDNRRAADGSLGPEVRCTGDYENELNRQSIFINGLAVTDPVSPVIITRCCRLRVPPLYPPGSTCGDTNSTDGARITPFADCSDLLAAWYTYNPLQSTRQISALSAYEAAVTCCTTNHPYPLRAACGDLFSAPANQAKSAFSDASCRTALGPNWSVDPEAADSLVDYAENNQEVALICCSVGALSWSLSATCGDILGDGSLMTYPQSFCSGLLAPWFEYDPDASRIGIDKVTSELQAATLCCATSNPFKNLDATCGDTNGDDSGVVPFSDADCARIAPSYYFDQTDSDRARIQIGGFSSVLNAAFACCKSRNIFDSYATCGNLDGNVSTPDSFTTSRCVAVLGQGWYYDTTRRHLDLAAAESELEAADMCCENDNFDSVYSPAATCGDVDGTGPQSSPFSKCADYSSVLQRFGGIMKFDSNKADVSLYSVRDEREAAALCCVEVFREGSTCGDTAPTFWVGWSYDNEPFNGCYDGLLESSLTTSLADRPYAYAVENCCNAGS